MRQQRAKTFLAAEVQLIKQRELTVEDIQRRRRIDLLTEEALALHVAYMGTLVGKRPRLSEEEDKENGDPQLAVHSDDMDDE